MINFRVRPESRREKMLLELAKEYRIQPGCRLLDRIIQDRHKIIMDRSLARAQALKSKEEAEAELRRLAAGE